MDRSPFRFLLGISATMLAIAGILGWLLPAILAESVPWLSLVGAAVVLVSSFLVALSGRRVLTQADRAAAVRSSGLMGDWVSFPTGPGTDLRGGGRHSGSSPEVNQSGFSRRVATEVARAARHDSDLALLVVAVDLPDGSTKAPARLAGLMTTVGEIVRHNIRTSDASGRTSDDRIAVILAETDLAGAARVAAKLRRYVEVYPFDRAEPITVSIGVAALRKGQDHQDLIAAAGHACENALQSGGNTVTEFRGSD